MFNLFFYHFMFFEVILMTFQYSILLIASCYASNRERYTCTGAHDINHNIFLLLPVRIFWALTISRILHVHCLCQNAHILCSKNMRIHAMSGVNRRGAEKACEPECSGGHIWIHSFSIWPVLICGLHGFSHGSYWDKVKSLSSSPEQIDDCFLYILDAVVCCSDLPDWCFLSCTIYLVTVKIYTAEP